MSGETLRIQSPSPLILFQNIGMNAHLVCDYYDVSVYDISVISKCLAWSVHNDKVIAPELDKIDMIKELLHVKFQHSVLPHFYC